MARASPSLRRALSHRRRRQLRRRRRPRRRDPRRRRTPPPAARQAGVHPRAVALARAVKAARRPRRRAADRQRPRRRRPAGRRSRRAPRPGRPAARRGPRRCSGRTRSIGFSTHTSRSSTPRVRAGSVDYLAFGPIFATRSKANPDPEQGIDSARRSADTLSTAAGRDRRHHRGDDSGRARRRRRCGGGDRRHRLVHGPDDGHATSTRRRRRPRLRDLAHPRGSALQLVDLRREARPHPRRGSRSACTRRRRSAARCRSGRCAAWR